MTRTTTLLILILCLLAAPCRAQRIGDDSSLTAGDPARLTLAPGDVIRITVWQQREYDCECPINADGSIGHPLYRQIKVTGLPLAEVENRLRTFLTKYLSTPTFEIQPLLRIVVAGEVRQPNVYTVPPGTSVAQVIYRAGGPTDRGRLEDVHLVRDQRDQRIDLTRPDAAAARLEVHSGDQILVGRRRSLVQDVVAPSASILAALAGVTAVIIQLQKR